MKRHILPLLAVGILASVCASAADRLVDISGTYHESGMTVRASPGVPSEHVSLCGLLSLDLEARNHKAMADRMQRVTITQYGDLAVEFVTEGGSLPDGSRPGRCHGTWTKADGIQVDDRALIVPRRPAKVSKELWRAIYRFSLDDENRLIVAAEFISTKAPARTLTAVYAFPKVGR